MIYAIEHFHEDSWKKIPNRNWYVGPFMRGAAIRDQQILEYQYGLVCRVVRCR